MGVVVVLCPKTGLHVSTGLELDQLAFDAMPITPRVVDCWACGGRHSWSRRWATLIECDDPGFRRAGTPMPKATSVVPA
jgi:hypothetical protein